MISSEKIFVVKETSSSPLRLQITNTRRIPPIYDVGWSFQSVIEGLKNRGNKTRGVRVLNDSFGDALRNCIRVIYRFSVPLCLVEVTFEQVPGRANYRMIGKCLAGVQTLKRIDTNALILVLFLTC